MWSFWKEILPRSALKGDNKGYKVQGAGCKVKPDETTLYLIPYALNLAPYY
jgi:hypothetical protein